MSQSPIDYVEDRVKQLQEISQRREQLLREMYHLLQRRDDLGSLLKLQDDAEDEDVRMFLERFNLDKNPESGQVVNLLEVEMVLQSFPEESPSEEQSIEEQSAQATAGRASPDLDSPMSDAPPSPTHLPDAEEAEAEQQLQYPEGDPTSDMPMDVDEEEQQQADTATKIPVPPEADSDDVLILESDDEPLKTRGVPLPRKIKSTFRQSLASDDDRDELDLLGSPSRSRASSARKSRHTTKEPSPPDALVIHSSRAPSPIEFVDEDAAIEAPNELPEASPEPEKLLGTPVENPHDESQDIDQDGADSQPDREISPEAVQEFGEHTEGEGLSLHLSAYESDPDVPEVQLEGRSPQSHSLREAQHTRRMPTPEGPSERIVAMLLGSPVSSEPAALEDFPVTPSEPSRPYDYVIIAPLTPVVDPAFNLDDIEIPDEPMVPASPATPRITVLHDRKYTLPPLSILPAEYNRKGKPSRQQRKKEKEREKNGDKADGKRDEWVPMGINKWGAIVRANPVYKRLSKATKTVSTHDWSVAWQELRLLRTLDKIEALKDEGLWSFRQPKKQRGVGSLMKTHWDYLLDEMKWMRIDFREERRWKIAVAYTLAHAVIEWHEAGTLERRVADGICVLWRRPCLEGPEEADDTGSSRDIDLPMDTDERAAQSGGTSTPANDYGSDDDSDDEQEKDVADALDPSTTLITAMEEDELSKQSESRKSPGIEDIRPKVEDIEDMSALHTGQGADDAMDVDGEPSQQRAATKEEDTTGETMLKTGSNNPLLGSIANISPKSKAKQNLYAPLRDRILSSSVDKLFIDLEDDELVTAMSDLTTDDPSVSAIPPPPDLLSIFPDFQLYGLLDVPESTSLRTSDGRKKSDKKADRDDPNRRVEDTMYTKVAPLSRFMLIKPTLLGTLEPALHFEDDIWRGLDDAPVAPDPEYNKPVAVDQDLNSIFDMPRSPPIAAPGKSVPAHDRDKRRRPEHTWTPQDDQLLKQVCDRYPNNWPLIADAFNSSRVTVRSDRRTAWDCYDRWASHLAPSDSSVAGHGPMIQSTPPTTPSVSTPMTTRGNRRAASISMAQNPIASTSGLSGEPKKRRRHQLVQDAVRKAIKRKETTQKSLAMQRKPAAGPHETHMTFAKLPKYTPQELSRMKAEKEARELQEQMHRRRVAELARQKELAQQQGQGQGQQPQQAPQQHAQQPGIPNVNGMPRTPGGSLQQPGAVPQIRSQVGISQQQRMALAGARISPSHIMQVQQARAAQAAQAQAQAAQMQAGPSNLSASALAAAHLSPAFNVRQASASPAVPHLSPPHQAATPSNAAGIPRPASTQMPQATQTAAAALAAHRSNVTQYYMPTMHGQQLTSEQMEQALARLNRQQEHNTQSANQMAQLAQNLHNSSYSQS